MSEGTRIVVCEGRRNAAETLLDKDWDSRHHGMSYLSHLSNGTTIDGDRGGNVRCFLNRALSPNRKRWRLWTTKAGGPCKS